MVVSEPLNEEYVSKKICIWCLRINWSLCGTDSNKQTMNKCNRPPREALLSLSCTSWGRQMVSFNCTKITLQYTLVLFCAYSMYFELCLLLILSCWWLQRRTGSSAEVWHRWPAVSTCVTIRRPVSQCRWALSWKEACGLRNVQQLSAIRLTYRKAISLSVVCVLRNRLVKRLPFNGFRFWNRNPVLNFAIRLPNCSQMLCDQLET